MATQGIIETKVPLEDLFDAVVKTCEEKKVKLKEIDKLNYTIIGETSFSYFDSRHKAEVQFFIKKDSSGLTILKILDNNFGKHGWLEDTSFITPFLHSLEKRISFVSKPRTNYFKKELDELHPIAFKNPKTQNELTTPQIIYAVLLLFCIVLLVWGTVSFLISPSDADRVALDKQAQNYFKSSIMEENNQKAIPLIEKVYDFKTG